MRNVRMPLWVVVVILSATNIALPDTFGTGDDEFTIDFVNISGDASSANGTNISGVSPGDYWYKTFTDPGEFRIGTYEITNDQWTKFQASYGIVTGSPSSAYDESTTLTGTNVPTNKDSWCEAAQFVNYLNTSTGHDAAYKFTGTQGTGDYTFAVWESVDEGYDSTNPFRNSSAHYFLPTEDEWVKAAYWNGTSLQTYANASPDDLVDGYPDPAKWNYDESAGNEPWNVGSGSEELNGTFDMMGNVWEWTESPLSNGDYGPDSLRSLRGGAYPSTDRIIASTGRMSGNPLYEPEGGSFRIASVPEPCSLVLLSLGGLMLRRRR